MDFGKLLSVAEKNEVNKQTVACYQTKFTPPKKESKQSKTLSNNIKKFLAKKEEEEKKKLLEEKRKRDNLLALRDHKAQSRINKHLKVCKAANKSVLADAVDNENTAVTIAGPSQPDEDDYGNLFLVAVAKKTVKDIALTKDRVKQALKQQEIDDSLGHRRRKRASTGDDHNDKVPEKKFMEQEKLEKEEKEEKVKIKKKPVPPPMDFGELLKLAEIKQHEPVMIEVKPKVEEERLMTKKQMKEYMKEKEWRERKEQLARGIDVTKKTNATTSEVNKSNNKSLTPKSTKPSDKSSANSSIQQNKNLSSSSIVQSKKVPTKSNNSLSEKNNLISKPTAANVTKNSMKDKLLEERKKLEAEKRKLEEMRKAIEKEKMELAQSKIKQEESKASIRNTNKVLSSTKSIDKQTLSKDIKSKQASMLNGKPKQFPPPDVKPFKSKVSAVKKPSFSNKRRIYDDDEEYDSELDDFIDDGPEEQEQDYSKYISEIFGYNRNNYKYMDDDDDTAVMESNFEEQLKEEIKSSRIGLLEDLEDIRKEAAEKRRKALLKMKMKK
ncbi:hypothetical protein M0802_001726 [Mischocyttarus mexicanus]|nr:hypothetical protein M0802_001726 [Mischocyttarus mexicanus]